VVAQEAKAKQDLYTKQQTKLSAEKAVIDAENAEDQSQQDLLAVQQQESKVKQQQLEGDQTLLAHESGTAAPAAKTNQNMRTDSSGFGADDSQSQQQQGGGFNFGASQQSQQQQGGGFSFGAPQQSQQQQGGGFNFGAPQQSQQQQQGGGFSFGGQQSGGFSFGQQAPQQR
jgi:hypothetical protein